MNLPYAEPFKIKMVEPAYRSTRSDREGWIAAARFNLFQLRSHTVFVDLLTDSGTGAMSQAQWAEIMLGDESYAGAASYYKLKDTITELLGLPHLIPTHQGRAAENVLFSALLGPGDLVPGNAHFDTTKGHIEFRGARAIDCTIDAADNPDQEHPFKGNIDPAKLERVLAEAPAGKVPLVILTVTCNTSGGQPVSLANIRETAAICRRHGVPLFLDAARFAENAYFIKQREAGWGDRTIPEIVAAMFAETDGCTMSCKKDGIVNIGGFLALRDEELFRRASVYAILYEGYLTYGGMAGRDMGALAQGLRESTQYDYLAARIGQVERLGAALRDRGVPILRPTGGHAVFVDACRCLPHVPRAEFPAQTLAVELYLEGGVRGVEVGTLLADRDPATRENRFPTLELLRLAIPRRVYTDHHMDYVAAALGNVHARRDSIHKGLRIVREAPIMRHFTVELERVQ